MKLITLTLENFKGIQSFSLDANGQNVDVYGSNGCGKSTLFDAFTWLLFGKNSHDEKDFGIKTLDEKGEVIPRIDHKVTAVIEHDGRQIELSRIYKEKWRKQRGAAEAVMVGNTTEYAYGPVGAATPISAGEYAKAINGLIDEKIFKLITDPLYFNERLSWQERRQLLMQLCGAVTEEEIVKDNADLEEVLNLAAGRDLETTKKGVRAAIRETNKKKDEIGPRIDECRKGLVDINLAGLDDARIDVKTIPERIEALRQEKMSKSAMDQKVKAQEELATIKAKIVALKSARETKHQEELRTLMQKEMEAGKAVSEQQVVCDKVNSQVAEAQAALKRIGESVEALRNRFREVFSRVYTKIPIDTICPACGQNLPPERVEKAKAAMEKDEADFKQQRAELLKKIREEGKAKKADLESKQKELTDLEMKAKAADEDMVIRRDFRDEFATRAKLLKVAPPTEEEVRLIQQAMDLKAHMDQPQKDPTLAQYDQEIETLIAKLDAAKAIIAAADRNNQLNARIGELLKEEKTLSMHLIDLERQLYLCEQFVREKTDRLSAKLEEKIPNVNFIMFRPNVTNEGIEECCETSYHRVLYKDLNTGARINVGLEIIKALADEYHVTAPIFIDNAESVVKLVDMPSQLIRLIVSENDKTLRVEKEN
ncbi:MAG: AAA family ATPase [Acidaminococcus intestini]|uniref:ATP-binding protein n=1 Tax=Acidaminococcus intestini TaxID=187327 RepID=UPI0024321BAB|nr:AAA family ATPase [Acidaminococcus intestini]MBS6986065.1 AAA family ATPase [Acidaminococcus intestini]